MLVREQSVILGRMGRPAIVLDELRARRIVDAVKAGLSRRGVAGRAGISKSLLFEWMARGADGEEPYSELVDRIKEAEAEVELRRISVIQAAADEGTWQACAWLLERTQPNDYALRKPVDETVTGAATEQGDDLETAKAIVRALESRKTA